jgi:hypothetical protein
LCCIIATLGFDPALDTHNALKVFAEPKVHVGITQTSGDTILVIVLTVEALDHFNISLDLIPYSSIELGGATDFAV